MANGEIDFLTLALAKSYSKKLLAGHGTGILNKRISFSTADWTLDINNDYIIDIEHNLNTKLLIVEVCTMDDKGILIGVQRTDNNNIQLKYFEPFDGYFVINYESSNTGGGGTGGITDLSSFTTDDLIESSTKKYVSPTQKTNWDNHLMNKNNPHETTVEQLKNVTIISPTDKQAIVYDIASSKWKNSNISTTDEKVKMIASDSTGKYLNDLLDGSTIQNISGKLVAKTLDGLNVTIAELNTLQGMDTNVKALFDSLTTGIKYTGTVPTKANLNSIVGMTSGDLKIVLADETHGNKRNTYIYSGTVWEYICESSVEIRDFTIDPIKLNGADKEVTGILDQSHMNLTGIARTSDLANYTTTVDLEANYAKKTDLAGKVNVSDIVDNLDSLDTDKPLSAKQGNILKNLAGGKTKVEGSSINGNIRINDSEVNVFTHEQSDWNQTDNSKMDYIKNKPSLVKINDSETSSTVDTYSIDKIISLLNDKQSVITMSNTAPTIPVLNMIWIDKTNPIQYIMNVYNGSTWVQVGSSGSVSEQIIVQDSAPTDTTKIWLDNSDIDNPIIKWYNGTVWVSSNSSLALTNQGTGVGIYSQTIDGDIQLRSIKAGSNTQVTQSSNEIVISSNLVGTADANVDYNSANVGLFNYDANLTLDSNVVKLKGTDTIDATTKLLMHMDYTPFGDDLAHTVTNYNVTADTAVKSIGSGSAYFNGTNAYLSIADSANLDFNIGSSSYTIQFKLRFPTTVQSSVVHVISCCSSSSVGWYIALNKAGQGKLSFVTANGATTVLSTATSLVADTWYDIAFVKNGTSFAWYVNGVQDLTGSYATAIQATSGHALLIGTGDYASNTYLKAYIDELKIWKKAFYTGGFSVPTTAYGTNYPTTYATISMKPTQLFDATHYSQINAINIIQSMPTNTDIKYALDIGTTYPKVWNTGTSSWVDCTDITTQGMTDVALTTALTNYSWNNLSKKFGFVATMKTTNVNITPAIDKIEINYLATPNNLNGHIVLNEAGTSFAQRANLQFKGNVNITDDLAGDTTSIMIPISSYIHVNTSATQTTNIGSGGFIKFDHLITKKGGKILLDGSGSVTLLADSSYEIMGIIGSTTQSSTDSRLICKLQYSTNNSTWIDLPYSTQSENIGYNATYNIPSTSNMAFGTISPITTTYIRLVVVTNNNITGIGGTSMPMLRVKEM